MDILTEIPMELDMPALLKRLRLDEGSPEADEFRALAERVAPRARPKAVYRPADVDRRGVDTVALDGIVFTSRVLRANLDRTERVFAYVATCGTELDREEARLDDPLARYWVDAIKAGALGAAIRGLHAHMDRKYRLGKTATMNPGSGDASVWPIEQQGPLFRLLGDVEAAVGVRLTDTFLMLPNKSVSGIRFATEVDFRSCQVCHRANCPSRAAPFDAERAHMLGHGEVGE